MTFTLQEMCPGVEAIPGEALRYFVKSASSKAKYLVDLSAYHGHGRCSCEHFFCRLNPSLRGGARPLPYLDCKHLRKARRYLAIEVAQTIIESRKKLAQANRKKNGKPAAHYDQEAPEC